MKPKMIATIAVPMKNIAALLQCSEDYRLASEASAIECALGVEETLAPESDTAGYTPGSFS